MYQLTWTQKEIYYKDFIKKPKNKFCSQWVLQRSMANAITKRQSKSYHVNKNDMSFCTQKLQLKDWQQNLMMYNQQVEIFKGRKKTDVQIQIELLREYCLQLNGKDIQSPSDIAQEDIRCLNADIDLFYKQASIFDPNKEGQSTLSSSQQIISSFSATTNSSKSSQNSQQFNNSYLKYNVQPLLKGNIKEQATIQHDEEDLGLNTHLLQKQTNNTFASAHTLPQFNMYDNSAAHYDMPISTKNYLRNSINNYNPSQIQQIFQDKPAQIQIKNETDTEVIKYIHTNHQNYLSADNQINSHQRKDNPNTDDLHTYIHHTGQPNHNYHFLGHFNQMYNHNHNNTSNTINSNVNNNNNNNNNNAPTKKQQESISILNQLQNEQNNSAIQQQQNCQQMNGLNIFSHLQQQNPLQPHQSQNYISMNQGGGAYYQQVTKSNNLQATFSQDSDAYLNFQKMSQDDKNIDMQQQNLIEGNGQIQDPLYNIYNNQDNDEQLRQLKLTQDLSKKEYQEQSTSESIFKSSSNNGQAENSFMRVGYVQGNNSGQLQNMRSQQYQQQQQQQQQMYDGYNNQSSLEDPEQLSYMNARQSINQVQYDNQQQKHVIQQQMYDGNQATKYINFQTQNQSSFAPPIMEVKIKDEEICEEYDGYNMEMNSDNNPQDPQDILYGEEMKIGLNYHDQYINQAQYNNLNLLNQKQNAMQSHNNASSMLHNQQTNQINYYRIFQSQQNDFVYDHIKQPNQLQSSIEEEQVVDNEDLMIQNQYSGPILHSQFQHLNNTFGQDIQYDN